MLSYIIALVVASGIVVVDQYTKNLAVKNLVNGGAPKPFIKGVIEFNLIKNTGGAWGMLSGYTWLLVSITLVITVVVIALLLKYGGKNKLLFWAATFVLGGGIGNMIDRVFKGGEVVDFLHFEFYKSFPTFNIADCAVCLGAGLLILYFIIDTVKETKNRNKLKKENEENRA